jgi:hypothetical protein
MIPFSPSNFYFLLSGKSICACYDLGDQSIRDTIYGNRNSAAIYAENR